MTRRIRILRTGLTVLAVCGLGFGLLLLSSLPRPASDDPVQEAPAEAPAPSLRIPRALVSIPSPPGDTLRENLQEKFTALLLENETLQNQMNDVLNWVLDNFRGRYPLKESALSHLSLPPLDENFSLHPELADFLNISVDEQFLMEDAFDFTRGSLRVLQEQNLSVTSPTPARVSMTFNKFPEEGAALRDDLYAALSVSLGPDRLERLMTVSGEKLAAAFDHFGQSSRTLMFEIILDEADNQLKVMVNDGWFHDGDPDQVVYTESENVVSSLPVQYRDFHYLLPEAFDPFMQVQ